MSVTSTLRTGGEIRWGNGQGCGARTVAGHAGEGNIHADRQTLSSALVNRDRCVDDDFAIVEEFEGGEGQDDARSNQGHCKALH